MQQEFETRIRLGDSVLNSVVVWCTTLDGLVHFQAGIHGLDKSLIHSHVFTGSWYRFADITDVLEWFGIGNMCLRCCADFAEQVGV